MDMFMARVDTITKIYFKKVDHMSNALGIPSVDLSEFTKGNNEKRKKFVQELGHAYETVGFVAVKNHGIPDSIVNDLYKLSQAFFSPCPKSKKEVMRFPEVPDKEVIPHLGKNRQKDLILQI